MAGDYVKMFHELPDEGAVAAIFEATRVPYDAILGRLFFMWRLFDRMTTDGFLPGMGFHALAAKCGGDAEFWQAVASVGWLAITPEGARIPEFEKHFGESARKRMLGRARTERCRQRKKASKQSDAPSSQNIDCNADVTPLSRTGNGQPVTSNQYPVTSIQNTGTGTGAFSKLEEADLRDDGRLMAWVRRAASRKNPLIGETDRDLLFVFSAAERALEVGENPPKLFASIVSKDRRDVISQAQEERGRSRLHRLRSGSITSDVTPTFGRIDE